MTTQQRAFPLPVQIACVKREISFRERVFAKRVTNGYMTQEKMDHEIGAMLAVLETLETLDKQQRPELAL